MILEPWFSIYYDSWVINEWLSYESSVMTYLSNHRFNITRSETKTSTIQCINCLEAICLRILILLFDVNHSIWSNLLCHIHLYIFNAKLLSDAEPPVRWISIRSHTRFVQKRTCLNSKGMKRLPHKFSFIDFINLLRH